MSEGVDISLDSSFSVSESSAFDEASFFANPKRQRRELWTSRQRQASNLHEISYRACFKPQLPAYFISRHTRSHDIVYDPFSGRGTTAIEAALLGRNVIANDVNPLSALLAAPRLLVPQVADVEERLTLIKGYEKESAAPDLSMFYEPETLREIRRLRAWLLDRRQSRTTDDLDGWIGMVATNRLTGHSPGFFSVYSMPPNQAITAARQALINKKRRQSPVYRDTQALILKKTRQLLKGMTEEQSANLKSAHARAIFLTGDARRTPQIADNSVTLTVTSPPFLDVINYAGDNWLRGWFNGLPVAEIAAAITVPRSVSEWSTVMSEVLSELFRVTRKGGAVAFEVGEVNKGKIKLEEVILPLGIAAGFSPEEVLINTQKFTKTAHIWGVANNADGTNSNRIVVFRKPG